MLLVRIDLSGVSFVIGLREDTVLAWLVGTAAKAHEINEHVLRDCLSRRSNSMTCGTSSGSWPLWVTNFAAVTQSGYGRKNRDVSSMEAMGRCQRVAYRHERGSRGA
jgi:hypothetical protein